MRFTVLVQLLTVVVCSAEATQKGIVLYGGTSGGMTAAVQASRLGHSVMILEPGKSIGGLTSGGLGATDIGNKDGMGGLSREFHRRVAGHYARDASWVHETREEFFTHRSKRTKQ